MFNRWEERIKYAEKLKIKIVNSLIFRVYLYNIKIFSNECWGWVRIEKNY
jgi:hypothetical protein